MRAMLPDETCVDVMKHNVRKMNDKELALAREEYKGVFTRFSERLASEEYSVDRKRFFALIMHDALEIMEVIDQEIDAR